MLHSICKVICLITIGIVTAETLCPKGCKCKSYGYCKDCEPGYHNVNGECKNCSANCLSCSSEYKCDECEIGYYKTSDKLCRPCFQGCKNCSYFNHCLSCQPGFFNNDRQCLKCSLECRTCLSKNVCITCVDGSILNGKSCQSCGDGFFTSYSHCAPCSQNCVSCIISNVCTKCKKGYFGKSCDQKCSLGCKDDVCDLTIGNCTCKKNHIGPNCNLCSIGKFGPNCSFDCPKECLTCDINGSCQLCNPGYYGVKCNCSNKCLNNKCNKWTGQCFQCKPFYKWPCLECVDGKYGNYCKQDCPVTCHSCSSKDSCSKCHDGYNGTTCDEICTVGESTKRCSQGFNGKQCIEQSQENCKLCSLERKCQLCENGFWGLQCKSKCPENCFDKKCNKETERCVSCVDGFHGNFCNLTCPQNCSNVCTRSGYCLNCKYGHYGYLCTQKCPIHCKQDYCSLNGICINCTSGFYGKKCENKCQTKCPTCTNRTFCYSCINGYFGRNCSDRCDYCKNATSCNIEMGNCEKCPDGMYGKKCEKECDRKCKTCNSESANKVKCLKCKEGRYGGYNVTDKIYNCNQMCQMNCLKNSCSAESGVCDYGCKQGYWGQFCENNCPKNCYNITCNQTSGICSFGCNEGYHGDTCGCPKNCLCIKSGGLCRFSCLNVTGDERCKKQCTPNCLNCDLDDGKCDNCGNDTFYGLLCDKNCSDTCNLRSCDSFTGRCNYGCKLGYFGDTCQHRCDRKCGNEQCKRETGLCDHEHILSDGTSTSSSQQISFIVLFPSSVILVLIVVILAVLVITRQYTQRKRVAIRNLNGAVTYRNSELMQFYDNNVDIRQPNILQDQDVLDNVAINACEQVAQESVYVNVTEYAYIERNQYLNIIEENEVEFQPEDVDEEVYKREDEHQSADAHEEVDDFLYANADEYLKRRVPINQLRELVMKKTKVEYMEEFKKLPPGLIKPFHESQKAENLMKNRYKDVYPYDSKRVILKDRESDYINASYIDGYKRQKVYIASLGPTVKQMGAEFGAFWSMVWQERVCKIVMLTNLNELGVKKCDKYWPDRDVCCIYENIKVTCQSEEIYPYFTVRIFSVEKTEKRVLYQMHFTAWPDKSTPKNVHSMIDFWEKLTRIPRFELGPIIVHCSAGVGRTGTFIALDILANEGVSEGTVDIFACVRNLREDRVNLIQTVEQYRFLHEALVYLLSCHTSVKALLTEDVAVQNRLMDKQLDK